MDWVAIGGRIKLLREKHGLRTQKMLADLMGVSITAVSNWENGKDLSMNRVFEIAMVLREPVDILLSGSGILEHNENTETADVKPLRGRTMPRYTFERVSIRDKSITYADQIRSHFPCSEDSFALVIGDRANADRFLPGDSVVIDPDVTPEPEDMVFAYIGHERKPVFRSYEVTDPTHYTLRALNPKHPSYPVGPGDVAEIIGVMSEHTMPRRI